MKEKLIPISKTCFACNERTTIEVNEDTYKAYKHYENRDGKVIYIQDVPVETEKTDKGKRIVREFLKTGLCRKCQKIIFG